MIEIIKQRLNEELTKSDISKEIKISLSSSEFKEKVEKIVKDKLNSKENKELEDKVVEITKNVIVQLFKALWIKRGFWESSLKNKSS